MIGKVVNLSEKKVSGRYKVIINSVNEKNSLFVNYDVCVIDTETGKQYSVTCLSDPDKKARELVERMKKLVFKAKEYYLD